MWATCPSFFIKTGLSDVLCTMTNTSLLPILSLVYVCPEAGDACLLAGLCQLSVGQPSNGLFPQAMAWSYTLDLPLRSLNVPGAICGKSPGEGNPSQSGQMHHTQSTCIPYIGNGPWLGSCAHSTLPFDQTRAFPTWVWQEWLLFLKTGHPSNWHGLFPVPSQGYTGCQNLCAPDPFGEILHGKAKHIMKAGQQTVI